MKTKNEYFREMAKIAIIANQKIYIKELPFPVLLVKQVFKNEDGSRGILYLVSSDTTVDGQTIMDVYQKRWPIEEYHKSFLCLHLRVLQIGAFEDANQTESFRVKSKAVSSSTSCKHDGIATTEISYLNA